MLNNIDVMMNFNICRTRRLSRRVPKYSEINYKHDILMVKSICPFLQPWALCFCFRKIQENHNFLLPSV